MHDPLIFTAASVIAVWGAAHVINTPRVIPTLHPAGTDDRRVITMEWVNEGVTLLFLAALSTMVTLMGSDGVTRAVLWAVVVMLNVMSAVSLATGARVSYIAYRLCPVIFTGSSLLVVGGLL